MVAQDDETDAHRALVKARWQVAVDEEDSTVRVGGRLTDGTPFLVEREFGRGIVLMTCLMLDRNDSNLPSLKCFVPLMHELVHYLSLPLVPSYNVARQPISDGASFIRPATLRGLPSHHTLVLVNGKRRHRASLVQIGGSGTQGPDLATIPSTAIASIEVLRDGASSQYGSDAIAGVINFNLKENREGISLVYDTGEYYEGDGAEVAGRKSIMGALRLYLDFLNLFLFLLSFLGNRE